MGILAATADERATNVSVTDQLLSVQLKDGRIISVPLGWYPRLLNATDKQRKNWQISADGYAIHWPDVDEDLSTEGLLLGLPAARGTLPIRRERIESDTIASMGYNSETRMMEIEFTNGEVYRYLGVPESEHRAFMGADSKGNYLNKQFKKAGYRYLQVK
jgi:KTSC domain/Protein of unknown function (DUF2442)